MEQKLYRCQKCGASVPEWFLDFNEGGVFDYRGSPSIFRGSDYLMRAEPQPISTPTQCYHCDTGWWPYPGVGELEDDYVVRIEALKAEGQAKLDEMGEEWFKRYPRGMIDVMKEKLGERIDPLAAQLPVSPPSSDSILGSNLVKDGR